MTHLKRDLGWILLPFVGVTGFFAWAMLIPYQILIIPVWFLAGRRFAGLSTSKIRSFLFGNSAWAICLLIFVWQFLLEHAPHRIGALEVISLSYISPFYMFTGALPPIDAYFIGFRFTTTVIIHTLVGYLVMFVIFTLGFLWGILQRKSAFWTEA